MSDKIERCDLNFMPDPVKGWKIKLTGECSETIKQIESLPLRRKEYLQRRIET